jgi:hypothetical protein
MGRISARAKLLDRSPWMHAPSTATIGLWGAVVATDGHCMLVTEGTAANAVQSEKQVAALFDARNRWVSMPMAELLEWLGPEPPDATPSCEKCGATGEVECRACRGTKRRPHDCDCEFCHVITEDGCDACDDTGKEHCSCVPDLYKPSDKVRFLGVALDRALLRRAVPATGDTVLVGLGHRILTLIGGEWAAVVMGIVDDDEEKLSSFEPRATQEVA